jgi:hypothetical protein
MSNSMAGGFLRSLDELTNARPLRWAGPGPVTVPTDLSADFNVRARTPYWTRGCRRPLEGADQHGSGLNC